jgi:hypothetical protein
MLRALRGEMPVPFRVRNLETEHAGDELSKQDVPLPLWAR